MKNIPPQWALKFFRWFCREDYIEEIEGDLLEVFEKQSMSSPFKAKARLSWSVLKYFRPGFIKSFRNPYSIHSLAMLSHHFKISWRGLVKQKMYSAIKIGGFSLGIAACLLIAFFVQQELTYDTHYPEGDRIYRIYRTADFRGETSSGAHFPAPFAGALIQDFPEFEAVGRFNNVTFFGAGSNEIRRADRLESIHEEGFSLMDQSLLDIFQVPFILGNSKTALMEPNGIVITRNKANKFFPNENPIGKEFILNNIDSVRYKITGVIEDVPVTTHIKYDFIMSLKGREPYAGEQTNWRNSNYFTYVKVRSDAVRSMIEQKMAGMIKTYFLPGVIEAGGGKEPEELDWLNSLHFHLQPVKDIYLNLDDIGDGLTHGDIQYLWLFGAIAFFILFIAGVNFINLSTAKSANRAKEVGLRKVVGSLRISLVQQFLTESLLFSAFSVALGLLIAWLILPYFGYLVAKQIYFPWREWWLFPSLLAGALLIGLLSGIYPAFYLASFKPIEVLKGKVSRGVKNSATRGVLVVFQFTISIILIAGTIIIDRQMNYVLSKKLGYDKEQVMLLQGTHTLGDKMASFKQELLRLPEVKYASVSGYLPVSGSERNNNGFMKEGRKGLDQPVSGQRWAVDHDYIKTMGLHLILGNDFMKEIKSDSQSVVINQSMVNALNLENPIGSKITNGYGTWPVIGVIEDFHFESMKQAIGPICLMIGRSPKTISIKIDSKNLPSAIQSIDKVWKSFSPHQAIRYDFLDQRYAHMYEDVQRMKSLFGYFASLAIIVACLGLFALAVFMVEQRCKEISIRMVLGASTATIFRILTSNFFKLVCISLVIAIPLSYILMQRWLNDFAYKEEIGWKVYLMTGSMAVVIAMLTISYQAIRAALMKPAEQLRSDG